MSQAPAARLLLIGGGGLPAAKTWAARQGGWVGEVEAGVAQLDPSWETFAEDLQETVNDDGDSCLFSPSGRNVRILI